MRATAALQAPAHQATTNVHPPHPIPKKKRTKSNHNSVLMKSATHLTLTCSDSIDHRNCPSQCSPVLHPACLRDKNQRCGTKIKPKASFTDRSSQRPTTPASRTPSVRIKQSFRCTQILSYYVSANQRWKLRGHEGEARETHRQTWKSTAPALILQP